MTGVVLSTICFLVTFLKLYIVIVFMVSLSMIVSAGSFMKIEAVDVQSNEVLTIGPKKQLKM